MSSEKILVCHGAMCQCKQGFAPDKLKVLSHKKYYINDSSGGDKLVGNTMDLGIPFEAGTFGQCKLQPSGSSYLPCVPSIVKWDKFYEKVELGNGGMILTEESKGVCAIAGSPVVEFMTNGQMGAPQASNFEEEDENVQNQLNPLVNPEEIINDDPFKGVTAKSV